MSYDLEYMMDHVMENLVGNTVVYGSAGPLLALITYVFSSLALYTIAQRRQIRHAWLAWVPVVNVWILGSISDQYRYVAKGQIKSRRKVLLALSIIHSLLGTVLLVQLTVLFFRVFGGLVQGASENQLGMMLMNGVLIAGGICLPYLILAIIRVVVEYMSLYDLYRSCEPANSVLYLVLSLIPAISSITRPLFLFLCRDKDEGMPPRRTPVENPAEF